MDTLVKIQKDVARLDENFANHALADARFMSESAERHMEMDKRLSEIEERLRTVPTKEDIGEIVSEEMTKFFAGKGKLGFTILTTSAAIVVSLAAILGGFKALSIFLFRT